MVGKALNGMLASIRQLRPDLRVHLIGHSFGARVVTAAVDGPVAIGPASLALLQGAFSHNGFAAKFDGKKDGFFRKVVAQSKVVGPILATHTVNDRAVGIAYALASRFSNDNAAALGDENDVFGGIGRNGAIKLKPAEFVKAALLPATSPYQFTAGKVHNLKADAFIGKATAISKARRSPMRSFARLQRCRDTQSALALSAGWSIRPVQFLEIADRCPSRPLRYTASHRLEWPAPCWRRRSRFCWRSRCAAPYRRKPSQNPPPRPRRRRCPASGTRAAGRTGPICRASP